MSEKEDVQKRYMELQELEQHVKHFQQQHALLNQQLAEILMMAQHVEDLENVQPGSKAFSSLGAGVYVESEVKESHYVLVNVGAGVLVKKPLPEAKAMLLKQVEDIRVLQQNVEGNLRQLGEQGQRLQEELQTLISRETSKRKV